MSNLTNSFICKFGKSTTDFAVNIGFHRETIGQFVVGQKDEYIEKFIALMKKYKIQDTLEFYSKLFMSMLRLISTFPRI